MEGSIEMVKFDHIIMNPPYTTKIRQGSSCIRALDFPIYKIACEYSDDVVCLMRRSQLYKKEGNYTGYIETSFPDVHVDIAIFSCNKNNPRIHIKSKYELNGKLQWVKDNDLTHKTNKTLWNLVDRKYKRSSENEPVPNGYVALNEVSKRNLAVFSDGEIPKKKNGDPLRMLIYIRTKDSLKMKQWLTDIVSDLHYKFFKQFDDINIMRGFSKTIIVPDNLLPELAT
jgi:hypothetical protein